MKIQIISEKDNPYMKRKELAVEIDHSGATTPKMAEVQQYIAKERGKDVLQVDVKNIFTKFGSQKAVSKIFIWEDKVARDIAVTGRKIKKEKKEKKAAAEQKEGKKK